MANKEVHIGDDWYLGENNDGDLIFYNSRQNEVVKAIDVITGAEDKKRNSMKNELSKPATYIVNTDGSKYYATCQHPNKDSYEGTDAATVINNAIADLRGVQGFMFIREGEYILNDSIQPDSFMDIVGTGWGTHLKAADTSVIPIYINSQSSKKDITIKNLRVNGNRGTEKNASPNQNGIHIGSGGDGIDSFAKNITIKNNYVYSCADLGITNYGGSATEFSENIKIIGNVSWDNGRDGISIDHNVEKCLIANNIVYDNYAWGIYYGAESIKGTIRNNVLKNNGLSGSDKAEIHIAPSSGKVNISDNIILSSNYVGIHDTGNYITISGNLIYNTASHGIFCNGDAYWAVISENQIHTPSQIGILDGATHTSVIGNVIDEPTYGIKMENSDLAYIAGNMITRSTTGVIYYLVSSGDTLEGVIIQGNVAQACSGDLVKTEEASGTLDRYIIKNNFGESVSVNDLAAGTNAIVKDNL